MENLDDSLLLNTKDFAHHRPCCIFIHLYHHLTTSYSSTIATALGMFLNEPSD